MATYAGKDSTGEVQADPRLINAFYDSAASGAKDAAAQINQYGSSMPDYELKLRQNMYADYVKEAKGYAAKLGVSYTPPEIVSTKAVKNEVPGVALADATSAVQDKLQTVDGYGKTLEHNLTAVSNYAVDGVNGAITGASSWLSSVKIPGLDALKGVKSEAEKLYDAGAAGYDKLQKTASDLSDAINKPINQVKGMSETFINDATSRYNRILANPVSRVVLSGGKNWETVLGASVPGINKLVNTYNSIIPNIQQQYDRVRNLPGELAMKLNLYSMANSYGMTDLARQIRENDDTGNGAAYHAELITQFDVALSDGSISIITDMVTQLGLPTVLGRYPDAISRIIKAYRFPTGTTAADYPARKTALETLLNLIDPNWLYDRRFSGDVYRMSVFYGASSATKKAFATDNHYNRLIMAATHYSSYINQPLLSTTKQLYPTAAL